MKKCKKKQRIVNVAIDLIFMVTILISAILSLALLSSSEEIADAILPTQPVSFGDPTETYLEFDPDVNYSQLILDCAEERTEESFLNAKEYEILRNLKIKHLNISAYNEMTYHFSIYSSWDEIFENNALGSFGYIEVKEYDEDTDYVALIELALKDPLNNSFEQVKEYERLNNLKVDDLGLDISIKTNYFSGYNSWQELFMSGTMDSYFINKDYRYTVNYETKVNLRSGPSTSYEAVTKLHNDTFVNFLGAFVNENGDIWYKVNVISKYDTIGYVHGDYVNDFTSQYKVYDYTDEDVYWLAVAITMEGGCSWYPEYVRNYIGCVVLNRVESNKYPDNIYDVLHQKMQYPWASKSHKEPYEWCIRTAIDILNGNRLLPSNVIFQAEFKQGNHTYAEYYDDVLDSWFYFCYY